MRLVQSIIYKNRLKNTKTNTYTGKCIDDRSKNYCYRDINGFLIKKIIPFWNWNPNQYYL